jgi:hypothetical protein
MEVPRVVIHLGRENPSMLRVITERRGQVYVLYLHGTVGGEWVPMLEQIWRSILDQSPSAAIALVLSEVEFIDPEGEYLLARMARHGVDFEVSGCMNRYVIEKLRSKDLSNGD